MAWVNLPVNYTDATWSGSKRYLMVNNDDGTVSFQDVTIYTGKDNSFFGSQDANSMNTAINNIMTANLDAMPAVDLNDMILIYDGTELKRLPASQIIAPGEVYKGTFDPATGLDEAGNELPLPATENNMWYWISSGEATWTPPGGSTAIAWEPGDWCISNGTEYDRVQASTVDIIARQAAQSVQDQVNTFLNTSVGHNGIYRGKYLGGSVTSAQYAAISAGTFDDLYIGDYWRIGGGNYRIAAFDYYYHCGDNADLLTHHVTLVPDSSLYPAKMNASNSTTGGYVGSLMYTTNLAQAKTTINAAFNGHVLTHRQFLTNSVTNGRVSGGAWFDSEIELMNEIMVYGSGVLSPVSDGATIPYNYTINKTQLPLFRMRPDLISNRYTIWLRDVIYDRGFAVVYYDGGSFYGLASQPYGVRPAFSIY